MNDLLKYPVRSQYVRRTGSKYIISGSSRMQGLRACMEDTLTQKLNFSQKADYALFGLYDGHHGDGCSSFLETRLVSKLEGLKNVESHEELKRAFLELDVEYMDKMYKQKAHGSTACCAIVRPSEDRLSMLCTVAHVGDTRCVLISPNGNAVLLTKDHRPDLPDEATRIEGAAGVVKNNKIDGIIDISRSIGDHAFKCDPTLVPLQQKMIPLPDINTFSCDLNDWLLIATNSVFFNRSTKQIGAYIAKQMRRYPMDPAQICSRLLTSCVEEGCTDNLSAMLIQFQSNDRYQGSEYILGYFPPNVDEVSWDAYVDDALKYGVKGADLEKLNPRNSKHVSFLKGAEGQESISSSPSPLIASVVLSSTTHGSSVSPAISSSVSSAAAAAAATISQSSTSPFVALRSIRNTPDALAWSRSINPSKRLSGTGTFSVLSSRAISASPAALLAMENAKVLKEALKASNKTFVQMQSSIQERIEGTISASTGKENDDNPS